MNPDIDFKVTPVNEDLLKAMESEAPSPFPSNPVLSFNQPIQRSVESVPTKTGNGKTKMIRKEQFIDKFNTKRTRVQLTPSTCDVCAFDVAAKKHGSWEGVPLDKREDVLQAVAEHKREEHTFRTDLIIEEDQMPKEWFGAPSIL